METTDPRLAGQRMLVDPQLSDVLGALARSDNPQPKELIRSLWDQVFCLKRELESARADRNATRS